MGDNVINSRCLFVQKKDVNPGVLGPQKTFLALWGPPEDGTYISVSLDTKISMSSLLHAISKYKGYCLSVSGSLSSQILKKLLLDSGVYLLYSTLEGVLGERITISQHMWSRLQEEKKTIQYSDYQAMLDEYCQNLLADMFAMLSKVRFDKRHDFHLLQQKLAFVSGFFKVIQSELMSYPLRFMKQRSLQDFGQRFFAMIQAIGIALPRHIAVACFSQEQMQVRLPNDHLGELLGVMEQLLGLMEGKPQGALSMLSYPVFVRLVLRCFAMKALWSGTTQSERTFFHEEFHGLMTSFYDSYSRKVHQFELCLTFFDTFNSSEMKKNLDAMNVLCQSLVDVLLVSPSKVTHPHPLVAVIKALADLRWWCQWQGFHEGLEMIRPPAALQEQAPLSLSTQLSQQISELSSGVLRQFLIEKLKEVSNHLTNHKAVMPRIVQPKSYWPKVLPRHSGVTLSALRSQESLGLDLTPRHGQVSEASQEVGYTTLSLSTNGLLVSNKQDKQLKSEEFLDGSHESQGCFAKLVGSGGNG